MLVSVSGSQGIGKSIFIEHLRVHHGIRVIERKTSRSILSDWGVPLSRINNDRPLTLRFQDEILKRKIEDETAAIADTQHWYVTERSYADLFTYAVVAVGKDNECSDWLDQYYVDCAAAQQHLTAVMYLQREGRINNVIVDDGVRGINQYYGVMVDEAMTTFTRSMCADANVPLMFTPNSSPVSRASTFSTLQRSISVG